MDVTDGNAEVVHAPAEPGTNYSPCCGLTVEQFPPYDRISLDSRQVTCGRLSEVEVTLLSGQPVVLDPHHEQALFSMSAAVYQSADGAPSLAESLGMVSAAMREILPADRPLLGWTAPLMVQVTERALELARR